MTYVHLACLIYDRGSEFGVFLRLPVVWKSLSLSNLRYLLCPDYF